jgi:hypothetical protein
MTCAQFKYPTARRSYPSSPIAARKPERLIAGGGNAAMIRP